MQDSSRRKLPSAPLWGWAFIVACAAIPIVALGGAIPGALGAGGATVCYALSRDGKGTGARRAVLCGLVTLGVWGAFGTLAWVVTKDTPKRVRIHRSSKSGTTTSRSVYRNGKLVSIDHGRATRTDPDDMTESELRAIYLDAVSDRSASHMSFVASHNKLFGSELKEIVAEGDRDGWGD